MAKRRAATLATAAIFALAIATAVVIDARPAAATNCNGSEINGSGSIVVQPNTECSLNGANITGNVTVRPGAALYVNSSVILGSVTTQQAADVDISSSYMASLSIIGAAPGSSNTFTICNNSIGGPAAIASVPAPAKVVFGGGCGGNKVCGPFSARFNSAQLDINNNGVAGAGTVVYNTNLNSFTGNSFGGGLGSVQNTPNNGEGNDQNNAVTRGLACPATVTPTTFRGE